MRVLRRHSHDDYGQLDRLHRRFWRHQRATPIIAGHAGLFFQMWADGIFGNEVIPGGTVFENRLHMTTAKAVLINNAQQYPFSGGKR